ncbi:MAG: hypothetical protein ACRCVU_06565 [Flavobacterium sp.]
MNKLYIIIAIIFIFRPVMPVVEYVVNYDYVATVLCENVDKPELQCNGKCHVAKELKQVLEHKSPIKTEKVIVALDFIPIGLYSLSNAYLLESALQDGALILYFNSYSYLFSTVVLQPPIL